MVLMEVEFQRSEVHRTSHGQLFGPVQIDDLMKGRLALVSPIDCNDDILAYLPVVTTICSLTKGHNVRISPSCLHAMA